MTYKIIAKIEDDFNTVVGYILLDNYGKTHKESFSNVLAFYRLGRIDNAEIKNGNELAITDADNSLLLRFDSRGRAKTERVFVILSILKGDKGNIKYSVMLPDGSIKTLSKPDIVNMLLGRFNMRMLNAKLVDGKIVPKVGHFYVQQQQSNRITNGGNDILKIRRNSGSVTVDSVLKDVPTIEIPREVNVLYLDVFGKCKALKELIIPDTVEHIAFHPYAYRELGSTWKCPRISIEGNNPHYEVIDGVLYDNTYTSPLVVCYFGDKTDVNISIKGEKYKRPEIVIGNYAFYNSNIKSFPNISVTYEDSVSNKVFVTVGNYAFSRCSKLEEFNSLMVDRISSHAFEDCKSLSTVKLRVHRGIENLAFKNCKKLSTLGLEVTRGVKIGCDIFDGTSWLESRQDGLIKVGTFVDDSNNRHKNAILLGYKGSTSQLTQINGNDIYFVADRAFRGSGYLHTINLPHLEYMGEFAFADCGSLEKIDIDQACRIPDSTFVRNS